MDISQLRKDYNHSSIEDHALPDEPFNWFKMWLEDAVSSGEPEPTAMVLSTVSTNGRPTSRVVLLKAYDEQGFIFFTNYMSRKGKDIASNPFVALNFFWPLTERQVRVEGKVSKLQAELSDQYFNSRPLESRINAIISPQSTVITSRQELEEKRQKLSESGAENLSRPSNWGGYCVECNRIEFWQGRPGRLHDRIVYLLENKVWTTLRLAP